LIKGKAHSGCSANGRARGWTRTKRKEDEQDREKTEKKGISALRLQGRIAGSPGRGLVGESSLAERAEG